VTKIFGDLGEGGLWINRPRANFLREQDGATERAFQAAVAAGPLFQRQVEMAYLVRVKYGDDPRTFVALCLVADKDEALTNEISAAFRKMFDQSQTLDTLFLEPAQRSEIATRLKPFYKRTG